MAFYNDRWIIANIDLDEILLLRKSTNDILLDRIVRDTNILSKESIVRNVLEEYDIGIGINNELYIVYQNKEGHLVITVLDGDRKQDIKLTSEPIPEIIDLNILVNGNKIHIIYIIKLQNGEDKYRIYHNYYDSVDWKTYIVEEIIARKVLNPMKLIQDKNSIILGYYINDVEIELKKFDFKTLKWGDAVNLVNSPSEKLYLDMIKDSNSIHLAYCEFKEGNLVVKYENFNYLDKTYKKKFEKVVSNEGSLSHPTIVIYENNIWVTWVELDKVISRVSDDEGMNWSSSMYIWDNTRNIDFVRYKYLTANPEKDRILDYSFGSVYPEVEFIGFGPLDNAKEVPIKKKTFMNLPRI